MSDALSILMKKTANKSLQATRDGVSSSAIAEDVIRPACLSSGRSALRGNPITRRTEKAF
jgi:hypothetical protein